MFSNAEEHAIKCPHSIASKKNMKTNFNPQSNDQAHPRGAPSTFTTIRPFKRWLAAGALGLLLISGNLTQAQSTAVSNLGTTTDAASYAIIYSSIGYNQSYAQSFTTGADPATLASVTLQIRNQIGLAVDGGGFTVSLYSDNAGVPGALLSVLTGNATPKVDGPYTYTAPPGTPLAADTTYWIWATVSPPLPYKGYSWAVASDMSETALSGWSLGACGSLTLSGGVGSWELYPVSRLKMAVDIVDNTLADQIEKLIDTVNGLTGVQSAIKHALVVKLDAGLAALKFNQSAWACAAVQAFINQTKAQAGKKIPAPTAVNLINDATQIRAALGCANQPDYGANGDEDSGHHGG
jgi:hypothetical protein